MNDVLRFHPEAYEVMTCTLDGRSVTYRAWEGLRYCARPVDDIQKLNLYAPEAYFHGEAINGYTLHTAPIFAPNTVGGYMQGPAMQPGEDRFRGGPNTAFEALAHGYVVACAGVRGRNTGEARREFFVGGSGEENAATGRLVGRAPAFIVDMKAAVRYLRHNRDVIPGDVERIVTNGTSAGGALSALMGATGNSPDYAPFLKAIGAADARDDIFAASCYCPIHNLENADAAYEWLFCGEDEYHRMNFVPTKKGIRRVPVSGRMTDKQIALSRELKAAFPAYVNGLGLVDADGTALTLDADGEGSFKALIERLVRESAQRELETHSSVHRGLVSGAEVEKQGYLTIDGGRVTDVDWPGFVRAITRMKTTPAFDALDLGSPECEEFGDEVVYARHFTAFSQAHSEREAELAEDAAVKRLNPVRYIGEADCAPHWRIRHGAYDRDTSLAVPAILAALLKNRGYDVDFRLPWGLPHSGDYDLEELFAWIDGIAGEKRD